MRGHLFLVAAAAALLLTACGTPVTHSAVEQDPGAANTGQQVTIKTACARTYSAGQTGDTHARLRLEKQALAAGRLEAGNKAEFADFLVDIETLVDIQTRFLNGNWTVADENEWSTAYEAIGSTCRSNGQAFPLPNNGTAYKDGVASGTALAQAWADSGRSFLDLTSLMIADQCEESLSDPDAQRGCEAGMLDAEIAGLK